jgi:hypothetical protein
MLNEPVKVPAFMFADLRCVPRIAVSRSLNLQFRIDAFNVISHTNFQAPNGFLTVSPNSSSANCGNFCNVFGFWEDYGDATKSSDTAIRAVFLLTFVLR